VELSTAAEIVIDPDVSISALLVAKTVTRSELRIFAVPEVFDWNDPSTNEPFVAPDDVIVTADAAKVGVTVRDVPTKASAVMVKV
jgi:hypothetical protein